MKKLLYLLLFFSGIANAQPIINSPSPINICDVDNTGFAVFNLETKNAEILGTLNPNEYAVSYHITLQNANLNTNPLPLLFTNTEYSYQVIYVRVQENTNPTNYATTVLYLDVVGLPTFPATVPNITLYENPYDGIAVFDFTEQTTILLNGYDSNTISYYTTLVDAQNGNNAIPNPNAFIGNNLQTIWARNQYIPISCFNITSFQLKIFDSNLLVFFPDAKFKARLIQQGKDINNDDEIQKTEALQLTTLNVDGQNYSLINKISSLAGIEYFTNLSSLTCSNNVISTLNLQALTNLTTLSCSYNPITTLNLSGLTDLTTLNCPGNQLSTLNLQQYTNLQTLNCAQNQLTTLDLQGLTNLQTLNCEQNQLTSINVQGLTNLQTISCNNNFLTGLNLNGLSNLQYLYCYNNQLTTLSVDGLNNLGIIQCQNNQLSNLNFENLPNLVGLYCSWNPLYTLNIKNGINMSDFQVINTGLIHVCVDESELDFIVANLGATNPNCQVNSYCNFFPGGDFNTISGSILYDTNSNGCDALDLPQNNIRIDINDGTNQGSTFTNSTGNYIFYSQTGSFTLTPNVENPTWFTINPNTATIPFTNNNNNVTTQNFCITPNGVHNDVEVVIMPVGVARPGFDATYKIVYKNKGNQTLSGNIAFTYDDNILDFINASEVPASQTTGSLMWNYSNLLPYENRIIVVTCNLNSPTETPAVNNGDILIYNVTINPITGDENPVDNNFTYNQTVVGSYDPNSIECLEGETVAPSEIGKYLHYAINFENLGTYTAENVVVKDVIDATKYDVSSLQMLNTSHDVYTRLNGNVIEFVFEGINLVEASGNPPVGGHGTILFKIKSKNNLETNDFVSKTASIYFDYNAPIETNLETTTFAALNTSIFTFDESVNLYPNPTNSIVNIESKNNIKSIELYDVQGRMLQTVLENKTSTVLDISSKTNGIYFLKINTELGSKAIKIIKN